MSDPKSETSNRAESAAPESACRKKRSDVNESFVKDVINHLDDFVHASYDEHKTCLQKTVRKLFGMPRAVETPAAPPAAVSVLPRRVSVSSTEERPSQGSMKERPSQGL